ncbi:efflux RND transporter permease subunit [Phyllobacterium endophyticum]|uniref:ABC transporter permease n=1 Tax=Phyllobacterium endophyticum TaxID=1149773 RepID=A0A2P7AS52_9HYPH|nr:efflux RND transporter permease subunit [Phyllobacterium endophyticum]MBB3236777.1 multidrug efflux pump subunit AcrB [Phyllobacterium endophyticum]PSH57051.1 ABC transporter permease [Phyllobacterium endophyticum]TYR40331.1 efflux RND transporter permease subunit [Phyllobacterium endophyticum]
MNASFSAWAIRNPLPPVLLFVVLTILGLFSFASLPITHFPVIDVPVVKLEISQPGMSPAQMELQVTQVVEDSIASLVGIEEMSSTVGEGASVTTVEFELEVPIDRAVSDVRDAVSRIRSKLPATIDEPTIERVEAESQPVVTYSVADPTMTGDELSWFVENIVTRRLQHVPGIGQIDRLGNVEREVQILLDPDQLQAAGLSATQVDDRLASSQIDLSGGRAELAGRERSMTVNATARSVADLAKSRIILPSGGNLSLSDVSTVSDTIKERRNFTTLNGKDVVSLSIFRARGASDVEVALATAQEIQNLNKAYPQATFTLIDDSVTYTLGNYEAAMSTLFEGAVLAVIVVFLFLRDWRATLIAAVTLPLSAVPTFWAMDMLGFSLNIISLLGLTLVTGILVDDAIVEIENIVRHGNMGKRPYQAALDASDEIGLAVIAISATIIAVFLPVGFMGDVIGQYFKQFGVTVAIAVFFSLLVARLITPVLAAYFMRYHSTRPVSKSLVICAYQKLLETTLLWRGTTLTTALLLFAFSIWSATFLPTSFLPDEDTGRVAVSIELPPGSTLKETAARAHQIAAQFGGLPEVRNVFIRGGVSVAGIEELRRSAVTVNLVPKSQRSRTASEMQAELSTILSSVPDIRYEFINNRGGRDVSFAVLSTDGQAASRAASQIRAEMALMVQFHNPTSSESAMRPELQISVHSEIAADAGVSAADIARTMRVSTIGDVDSNLAHFNDGSRQIPIRTQLANASRNDLATLSLLRIPNSAGGTVPLASVADIDFGQSVSTIERFDRERRIEIAADMTGNLSSGQGLAMVRDLKSVKALPEGVRIEATGDSHAQGDVFTSFAVAMSSGVMLVMVVLILLFGSAFTPLTILASLPLSIGGVVAALVITSSPVSLPVVIGILMLMGIVTKNAIMLVDFAIEREAAGWTRRASIIGAATERARPIVMTTIAMVAGMIPAALGNGEGGEFRAPMAVAVIGGLTASTLLSLVVVPALYMLLADLAQRVGKISSFVFGPDRARSQE